MVRIDFDALTPVCEGLAFPECPRWHEGALWFSDMADGRVLRLGENATPEVRLVDEPGLAGIAWAADGTLLAVAGGRRQLLRCEPSRSPERYADLSPLAMSACNDMVVDAHGRAYIGQWGFDLVGGEPRRAAVLLAVEPDGRVHEAATELMFANGMVITPDGGTLIVAETFAARLSAFTIRPDGSLADRRLWARLERAAPDGICLDAEGAVWVASPPSSEVLRIREGGEVTHRIGVREQALACMLGGADRRRLYIASSRLFDRQGATFSYLDWQAIARARRGRIDSIDVDVPGCGLP